jgi:hypothetical protein
MDLCRLKYSVVLDLPESMAANIEPLPSNDADGDVHVAPFFRSFLEVCLKPGAGRARAAAFEFLAPTAVLQNLATPVNTHKD